MVGVQGVDKGGPAPQPPPPDLQSCEAEGQGDLQSCEAERRCARQEDGAFWAERAAAFGFAFDGLNVLETVSGTASHTLLVVFHLGSCAGHHVW